MREALDEAGAPTVQPALFPAAEIASLPAGLAERQAALRQRERAGPGRPQGALNRKTQAFREYVLARAHGEHPVDGLIEAYNRPVHDLARELGCTPLEAFKAQMDARRVVLEYVEGKMPVSVNVNGAGIIPVFFGDLGQDHGATLEGEFFQPLSAAQPQQLEDGKLEDER